MFKYIASTLLSCLCVCSNAQTIVNIPAAADNTIYATPAGNSNALGQNVFSGTNGSGSPRRGLIRFDIASVIPPGAIITSATLTLNCNSSRSTPDLVAMHKLLNSWGEGTSNAGSLGDGGGAAATTDDATWVNRFFPAILWTSAGGDYNPSASASTSIASPGFYQWSGTNVFADVQSWVNEPASNFGWILICNETTISTARKFGSRENATVTNRPVLSVTYSSVIPVTLTFFKALVKNNAVVLTWETSQEINNRFFEIMHSQDGIIFSSIGKIDGIGTSTIKHNYQFIHNINIRGPHFYKLIQVDFDGKKSTSATERIHLKYSEFTIYPNPAGNKLRIRNLAGHKKMTFKIINTVGATVLEGTAETAEIDVSFLKTGMYYFHLCHEGALIAPISFIKL